MRLIDSLVCDAAVAPLPYSGEVPGRWPDVHDCLGRDHKGKTLIVTPAIVYLNAKGDFQSIDFEFAICQSSCADWYAGSKETKDFSRVIYVTILAYKNENNQVKDVSEFLHVKHQDLLKLHEGKTVMVLSRSALRDDGLRAALKRKFAIPVQTQSSDDMPRQH